MACKVALTGATGFVGRAVLPALLDAGFEVSVLVRKPQPTQFPQNVRVVVGDLGDVQALAELVKSADCVVHLAGAISALSKAQFFKDNLDGVKTLHAACAAAQVKRFVHVSTLAARMPSISAYAASKRAAEDFLTSVSPDMSTVILRPSAIYGPGDKATLPLIEALQKNVARIPSSASAKFSLIHVRDFAFVVKNAITALETGVFEVDDLAGGHDWAELARVNASVSKLPHRVSYLPKPIISTIAFGAECWSFVSKKPSMITRDKVRELYYQDWVVQGKNWPRPNPIGLAEGLQETLEWYRNHGWLKPIAKTPGLN